MKEFIEDINKTVEFIESCFDENNPDDGLTFDERIALRKKELSHPQQEILQDSIDFTEE